MKTAEVAFVAISAGVVAIALAMRLSSYVQKVGMVAVGAVLIASGVGYFSSASPASVVGIAWETDHAGAVEEARELRKPMMVYFTADWCEPCQRMERETHLDAGVVAESRRFVSVKIDTSEADVEVSRLMQEYRVMSLPTVAFVDRGGSQLTKPRLLGFIPAAEYRLEMASVR